MPDTHPRYFVMGWLANVHYDAFADLYTAAVPQLPQVQATAPTRQQAVAELQVRIAEVVGVNPAVCEDAN